MSTTANTTDNTEKHDNRNLVKLREACELFAEYGYSQIYQFRYLLRNRERFGCEDAFVQERVNKPVRLDVDAFRKWLAGPRTRVTKIKS